MNISKFVNKPFKAPRRTDGNPSTQTSTVTSLPTKRTMPDNIKGTGVKKMKHLGTPTTKENINSIIASFSSETFSANVRAVFTLMYRKYTNKKHKTWTGDGYALYKTSDKILFYNELGKRLASQTYTADFDDICDVIFKYGSLEFQLDYELKDKEEIKKAYSLIFIDKEVTELPKTTVLKMRNNDKDVDFVPSSKCNHVPISQLFVSKTVSQFKSVMKSSNTLTPLSNTSSNVSTQIINVLRKYQPVFDISKIENPTVMNKAIDAEVDVIVDPLIGKMLRSHQREGIKFMYDCIMGFARPDTEIIDVTTKSIILEKDSDIQGCLLADEMGLGKTLMTIGLIWTLLKQTPYPSKVPCSQSGVPLYGSYKKFLVVCPVTLIANWKREFSKWLNLSRIGVLTLNPKSNSEKDKNDVRNFLRVQRTYQVLIIGYEKLLSVSEELYESKDNIDLLICDEGHRLKNGSSKVLNTLKNLEIRNKVLLSGTPIQNDLNEFYTIIDFINPGILGSFNLFKKHFITPITKARDTNNRFNANVLEKGEERSDEMIKITKRFTIRRTNALLAKYLPPRNDIVLFCKPTRTQIEAFKDTLQLSNIDMINITFNSTLGLITLFKKICNSPTLIESDSYYQSTIKEPSLGQKYNSNLDSGKLKVLMKLLHCIKNSTDNEKVVIVSNYTKTLDIIENLMRSQEMITCRLDGSTPNKQRDMIVTSFNRSPHIFGFLLSAKSGGVGLNLIGASRLVLFDNDWNPSIDIQAMSRIHRDGQKRPCFIYRLVTTGCIDEKIFQRQLMKHSLSQKFLNDSTSGNTDHANDDLFNKEDLRNLFTVLPDTKSNTHDLICSCDGIGDNFSSEEDSSVETSVEKKKVKNSLSFGEWTNAWEAQKILKNCEEAEEISKTNTIKKCLIGYRHIDPGRADDVFDSVLAESLLTIKDHITFAFIKPGDIKLPEVIEI